MHFLSPLNGLQWGLVGLVPAAIVALYFLKLRRRPVQVPSTFLWKRSIEDLHVNTLFQRLRRNLLLLLQLMIVAAAILALLRPTVSGSLSPGQHYILLIDNSASMGATDGAPTRLDAARAQAARIIDAMASSDVAALVSFADHARPETSGYTGDRNLLRRRLAEIRVEQKPTSLREALEVADGMANPAAQERQGVELPVQEVKPELYIFTDGGFEDVADFALGNLQPHVIVVGKSSKNVAILAMETRRNEERPDQLQLFAQVRNFSGRRVATQAGLWIDGKLADAAEVTMDRHQTRGVVFDLPMLAEATLELRLQGSDDLAIDDRAYAVLGTPRKSKVLVFTQGDPWLEHALETSAARDLADVVVQPPARLRDPAGLKAYRQDAREGKYDLVVFDRVQPPLMPAANTLMLGVLPPPGRDEGKSPGPQVLNQPVIVDVNDAQPLMHYLRLGNVWIDKALRVDLPSGSGATRLIDSDRDSPLAYLVNRQGYTDCVLAFAIARNDALNTNWPLQFSFPLFILNVIRELGNSGAALGVQESIKPGRPATFRLDPAITDVIVTDPAGRTTRLHPTAEKMFTDTRTDLVGFYQVRGGPNTAVLRRFAVNLFDPRESDITPRRDIQIGYAGPKELNVKGQVEPPTRELWKWFALAAFAVLLIEWYIYNKRVYI